MSNFCCLVHCGLIGRGTALGGKKGDKTGYCSMLWATVFLRENSQEELWAV